MARGFARRLAAAAPKSTSIGSALSRRVIMQAAPLSDAMTAQRSGCTELVICKTQHATARIRNACN